MLKLLSFPEWYHFTFPPSVYDNSRCTITLSITGFVSLFNLAILIPTIITFMVLIYISLIIDDVGYLFM